ncbi:hypothetical protein [Palleronia pelagia]|uniref:Uncharacterized protein n=1 Tax=Palleronia pelagia TaxID=387096 RepID=A0A1H8HVJ1_9RHOB|nr:hypothetical protein [Palleronia pelagia]SEN60400.1 hypothetical protein SAMN04488011_10524 [Palleronia pelagia]
MAMIDRIKAEYFRLANEGYEFQKIKITNDAYCTLMRQMSLESSVTASSDCTNPEPVPKLMGMPIERVPVGALDAPCWQIITGRHP